MQTTLEEGEVSGVITPLITEVIKTPTSSDVPITTLKDSVKWHSSHRYLFKFEYSGPQPTRGGIISKFGRTRNTIRAKFEYSEYKAIVFALPRSLLIWIKHPSGTKTVEQLIEARRLARLAAADMAQKHGLTNLREREAGFSEHTIEQKNLDGLVRPVVEAEPEAAKERLGISINQVSHKDKVEFTGTKAKERVMQLERWLDGREFEDMRGTMREMATGLKELTNIIKGEMFKPPDIRGHDYL
jgi:hypothetical protein